MTGTRAIGLFFGAIINRIVRWLALSKIHPNVLTFLGLLINIWAAWLFAAGSFRWAGVVVTGAAIFDMVDGRVARATSQVTRFGGFFDSVLDRYSDLALYIGLLVFYASINRFFYIVLTAIVMMVDFSKIPHDKAGLGSTVVVLDVKRDEEVTYYLVTSEEADPPNGRVSTTSPIGRALLNKQVGDEVKVVSPGGTKELEIRKLTTMHDLA